MSKPRKIVASINFTSVDDIAPSAEEINLVLAKALNLPGLSFEMEIKELTCSCGSDDHWCAYHDTINSRMRY